MRDHAAFYLPNQNMPRVESRKTVIVARILWVFPILLLLLSIHQLNVALDLRQTLQNGVTATAQITDFFSSDRVDVSYDYISVRVELEDGTVVENKEMSLPHSFVPEVEGRNEIPVRVLPGADQEIVIESVGRAHWRVAAINAAMSFVGFLLSFVGIFAWNRFLSRKGDPALRTAEQADQTVGT